MTVKKKFTFAKKKYLVLPPYLKILYIKNIFKVY